MSGLKPTIHKHNVSEVQEIWGVSSIFQFKKAQPVHGIPAFQVRGHPSPSRHCTTDGLDVQDRSKECLLDGTTSSKRQTLVSVHLGKQTVPIQSVAIRTGASAQVVKKLMKPVMGLLRRLGMRNVIYMDDLWGGDQTMEEVAFQAVLTRTVAYLGFIMDSEHMTLMLPRQRILKIQQVCKDLLNKHKTSVREVAKIVGELVAAVRAVLPAHLHYRQLQMAQTSALLKNQQRYSAQMILSKESREELQWWIDNLEGWNGKLFIKIATVNRLEVETDASNKGWGAICNEITTQGRWTQPETRLHIN